MPETKERKFVFSCGRCLQNLAVSAKDLEEAIGKLIRQHHWSVEVAEDHWLCLCCRQRRQENQSGGE